MDHVELAKKIDERLSRPEGPMPVFMRGGEAIGIGDLAMFEVVVGLDQGYLTPANEAARSAASDMAAMMEQEPDATTELLKMSLRGSWPVYFSGVA